MWAAVVLFVAALIEVRGAASSSHRRFTRREVAAISQVGKEQTLSDVPPVEAKTPAELVSQVETAKVLEKFPENVRQAIALRKERRRQSKQNAHSLQCHRAGQNVSRSSLLHSDKYKERSVHGACNTKFGMWGSNQTATARAMKYLAMAKVLDLDAKDRVLDWGFGCGYEFEDAVKEKGFRGYGVDVVEENVKFATENTKTNSIYCLANGGARLPFPDNTFDAVISNAALYHLDGFQNEESAMIDIVRTLVPGGCAWMGWLGRDGDKVPMETWQKAKLKGAVVTAVSELSIWPTTEYGYGTYALVACKSAD
eukprot:TRINITY_DN71499_c0_g1_i1.p1 TRINITY_DN71499_c0_g1~~TRINITY_DN71499_c0_g1_i1.p1  ORF type:complete len:311 (+),score=44.36 TRINITY_DN71499_c0_g1_i1:73-1005(+)